MAQPLSARDLDDIGFQRKEWWAQRVGLVLLAVFLAAGVAGTFGAGPLSETTAEAEDGSLAVEYERFIRHIGMTSLTATLGTSAVSQGTARLLISRDLAAGWRIENVSPTPSVESSSDDWLIYEFEVLGETPPRVRVLYRGDGFGTHGGTIRAGSGATVDLRQWIYP